MKPNRKYALAMDMPDGKRAGYYAQIVKALAGKASLFDREKELLIFSSEEERSEAEPIMEQYSIPWDAMDLLMLPLPVETFITFSDFGFVSRLENVYVYADLVSVFQLLPGNVTNAAHSADAERAGALSQLEEHLLARSRPDSAEPLYTIETQHRELAEGIARAYKCSVIWVD